MQGYSKISAALLGVFIFLGLSVLGYTLGNAAIQYKLYDRSVTVKGLSEREYPADIVIWPIQFSVADNDLGNLYSDIDAKTQSIRVFLEQNTIASNEITVASPAIIDRSAQQYGNNDRAEFRYTATQTVTVYSKNIEAVRAVMGSLSQLGKKGIVFTANNYEAQTEYIFTRLNEVKPDMVEEATREAREVAQKFATDSQSALGKIKRASQGQFSINDRDKNNPHIKSVRVVSTVEYYLTD
ncbi:SIMPL domain-containing protein [Neptunomonas antarctica]|uniref:SIMPL domain-containing protein n=1 Tax=Neptunomonas antarctica TaxID=619304 RepID=A0A1N7MV88_9GAMM|nr:SIMPL domain-containing protein [Neptunomonas antarctica]SIS90037.1 hypothetical protein SAMN05421760_10745 [Neptunomonas antarctica]